MVDIHRKAGYDPAELLGWPESRYRIAARQKKIGFRTLKTVVPLDASPVKGAYGAPTRRRRMARSSSRPSRGSSQEAPVDAVQVQRLMLSHVFD